MRHITVFFVFFLLFYGVLWGGDRFPPLEKTLAGEIKKAFSELKKKEIPPYYISYRVDDEKKVLFSAELGSLSQEDEEQSRILTVMVRTGSPEKDNFHLLREDFSSYYTSQGETARFPLDNNPAAVHLVTRAAAEKAYRKAVDGLSKVKANVDIKVEEKDRSGDYTLIPPHKYHAPDSEPLSVGQVEWWKERLRFWSALFLEDPFCMEGSADLSVVKGEKTFVDSSGSCIVQSYQYVRLSFHASTKADDGMVLPVFLSFVGENFRDLPSEEEITNQVSRLAGIMIELREAPLVDPYTGPALLSGEAAGVFFHEIFGHRVEGQRMKKVTDGQTFKDKIGAQVLPDTFSVVYDPLLSRFQNNYLWGGYRFDDEGTPAEKVIVVEEGVLKNFLMSRTPIAGHGSSNGHGRARGGYIPVARQSNMIIQTHEPLSHDELREALAAELKRQQLSFGYHIEAVQGGFTLTGRYSPNTFNVIPLLVYRVYDDGRPDELVRGVDLIGTPLSMFSRIRAGGGEYEIFSGFCGAESGAVPVTAVSPEIFVSQIELQKKGHAQSKLPLLPRPDVRKEKR